MTVTVSESIAASRRRLAEASRNPLRDAELLLMHILGCDLAALLAHPERRLSASETAQFEAAVERRSKPEPIQYITGSQEFFGLAIKVTPAVLIPRPETELLVEAVLARLDREAPLRIADIGTGSGAIAIALAVSMPNSSIAATDISRAALSVAGENAARHGASGRVRFLQADLLAGLSGETFDAIIANPPYIADGERLEPQVQNYEPRLALHAGPTGLEMYARLIPQAREILSEGGLLAVEFGYGQQSALARILESWRDVVFLDDLQGIPRVAVAVR